MKCIYIAILIIFYNAYDSIAQNKADSLIIYSIDIHTKTALSYNTNRFLSEANEDISPITKITIVDTNFINLVKKEVRKLKDTIKINSFDVRCICLIISNNSIDTLAFSNHLDAFYLNQRYYNINNDLLNIISFKLPLSYKFSIDYYLSKKMMGIIK